MTTDPLDIIDAASKLFVDEIARLPRRVDGLERDIVGIKRLISAVSVLLVLVAGSVIRNLVVQIMG